MKATHSNLPHNTLRPAVFLVLSLAQLSSRTYTSFPLSETMVDTPVLKSTSWWPVEKEKTNEKKTVSKDVHCMGTFHTNETWDKRERE